MKSLLVSSVQAHSGKSAVCIGLGLNYLDKKLKVGYFKPLGIKLFGFRNEIVDEDAEHAKATLNLQESPEEISPVTISPELYKTLLSGGEDFRKTVTESFSRLSKGKDVLLVDGIGDFRSGRMLNLSDIDVAELLGCKILLVSLFDSLYVLDELLATVDVIRQYEERCGRKILAGLVFNQVPSSEMDELKNEVIPFLESQGVKVFGAIPKDKVLKSISIEDMVGELNGEVLAAKEKTCNLIESFLVGAMSPTHAMKYFRGKINIAVITGGDRSDIQLAALEANVNCLVLTGNLMPTAPILARADELRIPLVSVKDDTLSTVEKVEAMLKRLQVKGDLKMSRIKNLIKENINLAELDKEL